MEVPVVEVPVVEVLVAEVLVAEVLVVEMLVVEMPVVVDKTHPWAVGLGKIILPRFLHVGDVVESGRIGERKEEKRKKVDNKELLPSIPDDQKKKVFSLIEEFKNFAFKGNVVDLAVGMVIGSSFSNIVNSLVNNLITPIIGIVLPGDVGLKDWQIVVGEKQIPFGAFFNDVFGFLLTSAILFLFLKKFLVWLLRSRIEGGFNKFPLTKDQELLRQNNEVLNQIRDILLKSQSTGL
jgi:large conductance mechanosensitive channel